MIWETAILVGLLFGGATYLILQTSFVRILFGFILLSNAANLLVLAMSGRPNEKSAPVVLKGVAGFVDPLPQALILTAIVIGFGVTAYLVILLYRLFLDRRTANARELFTEPESPAKGRKEGAA
ncbi:MAG TPA: NADH-quinone oxidoreductase subunit K [Opitutaceae bacterium]